MSLRITEHVLSGSARERDRIVRAQVTQVLGDQTGVPEDRVETIAALCSDAGIDDPSLVRRLCDAVAADSLHPLQLLRISRLLNDPDDEVDPDDTAYLLQRVLDLEWPATLVDPPKDEGA